MVVDNLYDSQISNFSHIGTGGDALVLTNSANVGIIDFAFFSLLLQSILKKNSTAFNLERF
jgi:hypothetical protein